MPEKTTTDLVSGLPPELLQQFESDAGVGLEDVSAQAQLPILSLLNPQTEAVKNGEVDAVGEPLKPGNLYHSIARVQAPEFITHVLYIREADLPSYTDPDEKKLNYIIGGYIPDLEQVFMLYVRGMSLQNFWQYQKEYSAYTHRKNHPIPIYALQTRIGVTKRESEKYGNVDTIKLRLVRGETGLIYIESDTEKIKLLKEGVEQTKQAISAIVENQTGEAEELASE